MKRRWLALYLANWYAFAVAGVLMSLQQPVGSWLSDLPWTSWGTEIGQALAGSQSASGGAWWLLMGALLSLTGVAGSLVSTLLWLAAHDEAGRPRQPRLKVSTPDSGGEREAAFSDSAREAARLVEDPRLRSLIQQLHTRLG